MSLLTQVAEDFRAMLTPTAEGTTTGTLHKAGGGTATIVILFARGSDPVLLFGMSAADFSVTATVDRASGATIGDRIETADGLWLIKRVRDAGPNWRTVALVKA